MLGIHDSFGRSNVAPDRRVCVVVLYGNESITLDATFAPRDMATSDCDIASTSSGPLNCASSERPRALIVSHSCVVPANQSVFAYLADQGWRLDLVVPRHWVHEYASSPVAARSLEGSKVTMHTVATAFTGQPQRHFYLARCSSLLREFRPQVVFLEEESFSVPALQWGTACWRARIPFGVHSYENLDRGLPVPARVWRTWTLRHAAFVVARSPTAAVLARQWGAVGRVEVIPPAVPKWQQNVKCRTDSFIIGYAGRLVDEKGLFDLIDAAEHLPGDVKLMFAGNGPLREDLERAARGRVPLEIDTNLSHEEMARAFARMDVLVLPSRTTPTWVEQFGRVLVEALWCGVPVVGSNTGEIPWVIETTGGGLVFPEGDAPALRSILESLRADPARRAELARAGRAAVERLFSVEAAGARLDEVLSAFAALAP
jgi:glycosyltransferase involved in cell wall biosynthesis